MTVQGRFSASGLLHFVLWASVLNTFSHAFASPQGGISNLTFPKNSSGGGSSSGPPPQLQSSPETTTTTTSTTFNAPLERKKHRRSHVGSSTTSLNAVFESIASNAVLTGSLKSLFRWEGGVPIAQAFGINAVLFAALSSKLLGSMLTPAGFLNAFLLGTGLWTTLGWRGWSYCVVYLFLGQAVTKVKFAEKESRGLAEGRGGRRGPENVWGSAATGLACATAAWAISKGITLHLPFEASPALFQLGYVASVATKLADTFASEIGKAYGKTTFLITNLKRVPPGTEGAISVEGTAAAVVGGLILSLYGYAIQLVDRPMAVVVSTFAAFVACNVESFLGATLQDKEGLEWVTNEVVNFLNTLIGAMIAMALGTVFLGL